MDPSQRLRTGAAEVAALQGRVLELPSQLSAALRGPVSIGTTMDAIRAALAADPEGQGALAAEPPPEAMAA